MICSSKGSPSICLLKLSNTGSACCSVSKRGTLLSGSMLYVSLFAHLSFICQCDTVMTEGFMCTALISVDSVAIVVLRMAIQRHLFE